MKLDAYLRAKGLTYKEFGLKIDVSHQAVHRYTVGRVPTPDVMKRIVKATEGDVMPNDFFEPVSEPA